MTKCSTPPSLIAVFEREPWWRPELMRQFANDPVAIRQVAHIEPLRTEASGFDRIVGLCDVRGRPTEALSQLMRWTKAFPGCPFLIIGSEALAELEWTLRDLGATHLLTHAVRGGSLRLLITPMLNSSTR